MESAIPALSLNERGARPILFAAASVLIAFGLLKLLTLRHIPVEQLLEFDPVLHVRIKILLPVMAMLEVAAGCLIIRTRHTRFSAFVVGSMGAGFVAYHIAYLVSAPTSSCPCLGAVPHWLPSVAVYQEALLGTIAYWLLLVGCWCCRWCAVRTINLAEGARLL